MKLFAMAGSLRKASHNRVLLGVATAIAERHGALVAAADALLIASPETNLSVPGA